MFVNLAHVFLSLSATIKVGRTIRTPDTATSNMLVSVFNRVKCSRAGVACEENICTMSIDCRKLDAAAGIDHMRDGVVYCIDIRRCWILKIK